MGGSKKKGKSMKTNDFQFDWTKFLIGLLSALMGALTASAAVAAI